MMTEKKKEKLSRRDFLRISKNTAIGVGIAGMASNWIWVGDGLAAVPASQGYLLVDMKKCQGCITCMLSCSLVHEGVANPSLSRIQIMQNPDLSFPNDITISQCRQCVDPACVNICPAGALTANAAHGHVRMVDQEKCIGCGQCVNACPFTPSRAILADEDNNGSNKSRKCDLCADTPHHWDQAAGGGPDGKQACVEVCPVSAIQFTDQIPVQNDSGYYVNLRGVAWGRLGYPTD